VAIDVRTKDCAGLGDAEFAEMADLVAGSVGWEAGMLSKEAEEWVLASQAYEQDSLRGFMLATLERIGGTPALVIGAASVARTKQRAQIVKGLMHENYHKALMAFPDEDVIVACRIVDPGPLDILSELSDVRPWPEQRANGEERAWGRRLSKRFGAVDFDDRTMIAVGDGEQLVFDHDSGAASETSAVLDDCKTDAGQYVIAWGWAMAEFLEDFQKPSS
jgi:hypothetical protein